MFRVRALVVVGATGVVLLAGVALRAQSRVEMLARADARALFELYDRGDYAGFERALIPRQRVVTNWWSFEVESLAWINPAPQSARRRLIAASVGLELAYAQRERWEWSRTLIEVGCRLLRQQPATDVERHWHLAAATLARLAADWDFLLPPPGRDELPAALRDRYEVVARQQQLEQETFARNGDVVPFEFAGHLEHAIARFPQEPMLRFSLARAWEEWSRVPRGSAESLVWLDAAVAEQLVAAGADRVRQLPLNVRMDAASAHKLLAVDEPAARQAAADQASRSVVRFRLAPARFSLQLWKVIDHFTHVPLDQGIAPEVHLRLGLTYERLARPDLALPEYVLAAQTSRTPVVNYMARFSAGGLLARAGRTQDAEQALRAALATIPRAQSATFALAPLLIENGQGDEAAALLNLALTAPLAPDPMKSVKSDDPERWRADIDQLRRVLQ